VYIKSAPVVLPFVEEALKFVGNAEEVLPITEAMVGAGTISTE
jgi:hypothetical protein